MEMVGECSMRMRVNTRFGIGSDAKIVGMKVIEFDKSSEDKA